MKHGEIRWYKLTRPDKKRPVLILTRDSVLEYLGEVTVATDVVKMIVCVYHLLYAFKRAANRLEQCMKPGEVKTSTSINHSVAQNIDVGINIRKLNKDNIVSDSPYHIILLVAK